MSPVSPVSHTVLTVRIVLKNAIKTLTVAFNLFLEFGNKTGLGPKSGN